MNKDQIENSIIDYLNGELNAEESAVLSDEVNNRPEMQLIYDQYVELFETVDGVHESKVPPSLNKDFRTWLTAESKKYSYGRIFNLNRHWMQNAAICGLILAVGLLIGLNINNNKLIDQYASQLNSMQSNMLSLLEENSVGSRIKAVNMSHDMVSPHAKVKEALIQTLHFDESPIVRLATVKVLANYENDPEIKSALIYATEKETDPAVQIALINLISQMNDKSTINQLDQIIANENAFNFVKDEAHSAKLKLTSH